MFDIVRKIILSRETTLEISRYQPDGDLCPADFHDYFVSSFVLNSKNPNADLGYWLADLHARFTGEYLDECEDTFYALKWNDVFAARMWFGISRRSRIGNFGHVCTEPEFRRRGLLNHLMQQFKVDFADSGASLVGCATGNPVAAKCYVSHGFQLLYDGETGPLFYGEDYLKLAEKAFAPGKISMIRKGTPGDQFGCDKLLSYSPGVWGVRHPVLFPDFRSALLEQRAGNAVVCVAENTAGFPVGYAFVRRFGTQSLMDFLVHPNYQDGLELLTEETRRIFSQNFPDQPAPQDFHKINL